MKDVQTEIVKNLLRASAGYGRAGLALLHGERDIYRNYQAAIGNFAIATELLLKGYIANHNLILLLKDIPLELKCALTAFEELPPSFKRSPLKVELRSSAFKNIKFDEAVAVFGMFFPEIKKRLNSHLKFLTRYRNLCVHAALPDFREYEVQRSAFLYLKLLRHLKEKNPVLFKYHMVESKEKIDIFLRKFDEERLNRVHSSIEAAKERAKQLETTSSILGDDWNRCVIECPVCGSDGLIYGETQAEEDFDADQMYNLILTFVGDFFECYGCGLKLEDYNELEIAGIDPVVDLTDKAEKWQYEH